MGSFKLVTTTKTSRINLGIEEIAHVKFLPDIIAYSIPLQTLGDGCGQNTKVGGVNRCSQVG